MSQRHYLAVVSGAATLLAAVPLSTVFLSWTWMFFAAIAIALIVGAASLVRVARGPAWAQLLAMLGALLLYVTWLFPSGEEFFRFVPTMQTFLHFNQLFVEAGDQIREQSIPVPDLDGLLLLTTVGIGLVAILVDLAAVGLRKPALAGLPMLAIYSVPVAVLPDGLSVFGFLCAAAGYLWLLVTDSVDRVRRFGRRFTGDGRDIDLWEPSPLAAAGRRLGLVGVVLAMLLPLAVPGMTSGLLDRWGTPGDFGDGPGTGTGRASTVDLTAYLSGNLKRNEVFPMVNVSTDEPAPYYLRFGVADQVTRDGFVSRAPGGGKAVNRGIDYNPPTGAGVSSSNFKATVQAVNLDMPLAPTYQQVTDVRGLDNQWFYDGSTDQVFSRRPSIMGASYELDYVRVSFTLEALRRAREIATSNELRPLIDVPQVSQVTDIVESLTTGKITQYDKVRAIYDFFTDPDNNFTYSLTAEQGTSGNDIVEFLTARKGFCVQYAAAMTWLVRAAGYPARVAFGFTRGSGAQNGVYSLTNFNLHAWTEVYFNDLGWVPFDATPAASVAGSVSPPWAPDPRNPGGTGNESPDVPDQPTTSPGAVVDPTAQDPGGDAVPGPGLGPINLWWLIGGGAGLLVVGLLLAPALRRSALRRRRRSRSAHTIVLGVDSAGPRPPAVPDVILDGPGIMSARADAHAAWAEMLDTMVDYRIPVDEAETPRATAKRLGHLPAVASAIRRDASVLARAVERARYALAPMRPDGLDAAVGGLRSALSARATRWERLSARLMPRSVVLRWRLAAARSFANAVATGARWRDRVVGVLSVRRLIASRGIR